MARPGRSGLGPASADMLSSGVPQCDAKSSFSGGPQLKQSIGINADSCMRVPASPMSCVIDGSLVQQSPLDEQVSMKRAASVPSQPVAPESGSEMNSQKKPRIDMRQGDARGQQGIQQLIQYQDPLYGQGQQNPQMQAIIMQQSRLAQLHRQRQQQQQQQLLLQMIQQQQQQLRPKMLPPAKQLVSTVTADAALCARRFTQYLYHKRQRPAENSISYWRKLVDEYFAPRARKRWCVSSYHGASHSLGVLPQIATDAWHCEVCGCKSGKGFEATFEILPRLWQFKFDRGVIEEYLFVDLSRECRLPNGIMVLEYGKAVQEDVYENLRVVHEGRLRVIFTAELKITSWEFCIKRHEEYVSRRLVAPQVNQLLQLGQKCRAAVTETGISGASYQDMQASCNMFVTAGHQLAKTLDPQMLNEHGFSKRYVRCLQMYDVVNVMTDLIEHSHKHNTGPIESFKNYPRHPSAKLQTEKIQEANATSLPTDQSIRSNLVGINPENSNHMNNGIAITRVDGNPPQSAVPLNSYQNPPNVLQQEASKAIVGLSQAQPVQLQNSVLLVNGSSGSFQQQPTMNGNLPHSNNHFWQHAIQQRPQEAKNNNTAAPDPARMNSVVAGPQSGHCPGSTTNTTNTDGVLTSRNNSFKSINSIPTAGGSGIGLGADSNTQLDLAELDSITEDLVECCWFLEEPADAGLSWKS